MESPLHTLTLATLGAMESALNHALDWDPAIKPQLARLAGKVIAVECLAPPFKLYILPGADGFHLHQQIAGDPDAGIRASAGAFLRLLTAEQKSAPLFDGSVQLSGDSQLIVELQQILSRLDIDWEAHLATFTGELAAHQLSELARKTLLWGQQAGATLRQDLEEYLHEESRLLPGRNELECFYEDIDRLRLDCDRLEARVQRLQQRLTPQTPRSDA